MTVFCLEGEFEKRVCPAPGTIRLAIRQAKPQITFHYLPLGPHLAQSFGAKDITHLLQSRGGECPSTEMAGIMNNIHDSPKRKKQFHESGSLHGDPWGFALFLCLDGLNPWSKNKDGYPTWPVVLGQLKSSKEHQVPIWKFTLLLVGIIPSRKNEGEPKYLNLYLELLGEELISLCEWKIYDDYQKAPFHLKVKILVYVLHYQGLGKLFSLTATR